MSPGRQLLLAARIHSAASIVVNSCYARCPQAAKAKQPQKAIEIFEAMSEVGVQVGTVAPLC